MLELNLLQGDLLTLVISGTAVLILLFLFIINLMLLYQKKQKRHLREKIELQAQFSQTLLQSQLEIKEQTLSHISRELHDNLGQVASLIKINLNTLPTPESEKAAEKLENTKALMRELIADIKGLSLNLNGDRILRLGLAGALAADVELLNKSEQFEARFHTSGSMPVIDNDKMIILYRMAQEVLNNIVKHSAAKQITVSLTAQENLVILALSDDGKGFNPDAQQQNAGSGLQNLQHRARLINAQLAVQSSPGKGSQITIELPV